MGDIVTQIQDQINFLCSTMYNLPGSLQRDAPPQSLDGGGEAAAGAAAGGGYDVSAQTEEMAEQIVEASKTIDMLVRALPSVDATEEEQLKRIAELQAENDRVGQELDDELEKSERQLQELQDIFAVLADAKLQAKTADRQTASQPAHQVKLETL